MNRISPPLRGLYWKEIHQVIPLVLMLVSLSAVLVLMWSAMDVTSQLGSIIADCIPLTMPSLFAAGVGAILVGQEKETRTMLWCSSLPIAPSQIIQVKYVVAVVGLIMMWLFSIIFGGFAGIIGPASSSWVPTPGNLGPANMLYWFLHSVFVLCAGFYTTWKLKNVFASLVALIPIASVPYLTTQLFYTLTTSGRYISLEESAGVLSVSTLVGIIIMAFLGYRAAIKALSPVESDDDGVGSLKWLSAWRPVTSVPIADSPFRFSLSSLVWQSIHHNRIVLLLLFVALIVGTLCGVLTSSVQIDRLVGGVVRSGLVAGLLAVSWLGVFAFNGDGSAARMRFLADRGVSPTLAWLGRQLIGLSMIAFTTLLYALASYWFLGSDFVDPDTNPNALSMLAFGFALLAIYSVSQWTSQLIGILAASAFVAPVISFAAVSWLLVSVSRVDAPWWTLVLCVAIPLFATWAMMRRYMDNSANWRNWASGLAVAGLLFALPVAPFTIEVWNWPAIPSELRAELMVEALRIPAPANTPQMIGWGTNSSDDLDNRDELSDTEALAWLDKQIDSPKGILSIGDTDIESRIPLEFDRHVFWMGLEAAEYSRVMLESNPNDAENVERIGEWINTYAVIAKRLRLSNRWFDQEAADTAEIWLTAMLSDPLLKNHLDRDFARVAIDVISDQTTRNESRRRAVLATWRDDVAARATPQDIEGRNIFGPFAMDRWFEWYKPAKRKAILDRSIDMLVAKTIRYLEVGSSGEDTEEIRRELHSLMIGPFEPFELGPYADTFRATGAANDPNYYHQNFAGPGTQWYAPWEAAAVNLKTNKAIGE